MSPEHCDRHLPDIFRKKKLPGLKVNCLFSFTFTTNDNFSPDTLMLTFYISFRNEGKTTCGVVYIHGGKILREKLEEKK